jgi:hypothetical protein
MEQNREAEASRRQKSDRNDEILAGKAEASPAVALTIGVESTETARCARRIRIATKADKSATKSTIDRGSTSLSRIRCATAAIGNLCCVDLTTRLSEQIAYRPVAR